MNLYDKVKKIADKQDKPISRVEKEAGIANGTISGWKTSKPMADTLVKVAKVLDTPIEELFA